MNYEPFQDQNKMNSTQDPRPGIQTLRETVHTVLVDEAAQAIAPRQSCFAVRASSMGGCGSKDLGFT